MQGSERQNIQDDNVDQKDQCQHGLSVRGTKVIETVDQHGNQDTPSLHLPHDVLFPVNLCGLGDPVVMTHENTRDDVQRDGCPGAHTRCQ